MKHIKKFLIKEDISQSEFDKKYLDTRGIGKLSDFEKLDIENKLIIYNEDYLMSKDCQLKSHKGPRGQIRVTIDFFRRGKDGYPQFVMASSQGTGRTYQDAYLIAVRGILD